MTNEMSIGEHNFSSGPMIVHFRYNDASNYAVGMFVSRDQYQCQLCGIHVILGTLIRWAFVKKRWAKWIMLCKAFHICLYNIAILLWYPKPGLAIPIQIRHIATGLEISYFRWFQQLSVQYYCRFLPTDVFIIEPSLSKCSLIYSGI